MAKEPFLPLFFGDFLGATATWSGEEQALYLLLLGYQWASGPLPTEMQKLSCMARYEQKRFRKLWETVSKKFAVVDGGLLNLRLEEHRKKANDLAEVASARGKAGAMKRWGHTASNAPSMPEAMLQASAKHASSNSSIPSYSEEKIKNPAAPAICADLEPDPDPDSYLIWTAGIQLLGESKRSLMGKLVKEHGRELVARKLGELMAMTEKPRDPAAYFIGVMRKLERRAVY